MKSLTKKLKAFMENHERLLDKKGQVSGPIGNLINLVIVGLNLMFNINYVNPPSI